MRLGRGLAVAAMLAVLPAGCSWLGLGGEEDAPAAVSAMPLPAENVQAIRELEVGRTRRGIALAAFGTAPGLGYSNPRLVARRDGEPAADGMLDFDFVVNPPPPELGLGQGSPRARAVRADAEIPMETARRVRGVRVHAVTGGVQMFF